MNLQEYIYVNILYMSLKYTWALKIIETIAIQIVDSLENVFLPYTVILLDSSYPPPHNTPQLILIKRAFCWLWIATLGIYDITYNYINFLRA